LQLKANDPSTAGLLDSVKDYSLTPPSLPPSLPPSQLKANDPSTAGLFDSVKSGDPMAIATLQQKFADKYLGGIDLDAFAVGREGGREGGRECGYRHAAAEVC